MTDQTTPAPLDPGTAPAPAPLDLAKPADPAHAAPEPAPAPAVASPTPTPVGTLRQVTITGPAGLLESRWGIVTDSRVYAYDTYDTTDVDAAGQPVVVHHAGVQDTVELLSGHTVIVEH